MKTAGYIILLVIPLVLGSILKLALIDDVPDNSNLIKEHINTSYVRPLWIEFLILLFVIIIAWTSSADFQTAKLQPNFAKIMQKLIGAIAVSLFVCAVMAIGLPRWHEESLFLTAYFPAAVAFTALAFSVASIRS